MSEKINRAIVALVAAGLNDLSRHSQSGSAIRGIDFNTIGLLIGMMVIVAITRQSASSSFWRSGRPRRSTPSLGAFW